MSNWDSDLNEALISRPHYYGCPRILAFINIGFFFTVGMFFQIPGTVVPLIIFTAPCMVVVHLWAAWLTYKKHPLFFNILGRRTAYRLRGSGIGRFHV